MIWYLIIVLGACAVTATWSAGMRQEQRIDLAYDAEEAEIEGWLTSLQALSYDTVDTGSTDEGDQCRSR